MHPVDAPRRIGHGDLIGGRDHPSGLSQRSQPEAATGHPLGQCQLHLSRLGRFGSQVGLGELPAEHAPKLTAIMSSVFNGLRFVASVDSAT